MAATHIRQDISIMLLSTRIYMMGRIFFFNDNNNIICNVVIE